MSARRGDFHANVEVALLRRAHSRVRLAILDAVVTTFINEHRERILAVGLQQVFPDRGRALWLGHQSWEVNTTLWTRVHGGRLLPRRNRTRGTPCASARNRS